MKTRLIICDTCRVNKAEPVNGKTCGEQLHDLTVAAHDQDPSVTIEKHSCLMGCDRACNIAITSEGRMTYVLGEFTPDQESAEAILKYTRLYSASSDGRVPYREWPDAIKGHFTARIPPKM
ncbi:MAG: DUF1636 domain-containing protein [Pseudomonadota bacterium]